MFERQTWQHELVRLLSLILLVGTILFGSGCGTPAPPKKMPKHEWVERHSKADRLNAPPAGMALVNFHRPGYIYRQFTYAVYGGDGKFLADVPIMAEAQCLFDPGDQVFIGWLGNIPVSVVQASLQADKIYDILIPESMHEGPHLVPLLKSDPQRTQLPEWEASEDPVTLVPLERVRRSEAKAQPKVEKIKNDFLGGPKSGRVSKLGPKDCR